MYEESKTTFCFSRCLFFAMAILELLAASARTEVIPPNFWSYPHRFLLGCRRIMVLVLRVHHFLLATATAGYQLFFPHLEFTHVGLFLTALPQWRIVLLDRYARIA